MGKLARFAINFSTNGAAVYFAGQTLQGTVIVELNEPMKMRGNSVKYYT